MRIRVKPEIIFHVHVHVSCSSPRQKFLPIDIITVVTSRKTVWVIFAPLSMVRFGEKDKFIVFRSGGMQWGGWHLVILFLQMLQMF